MEHPISTPPQYNKEILDNRKNIARDKCVVDYAFYGAAGGEFPEEITEIAKEGIVAIINPSSTRRLRAVRKNSWA